MRIGFVLPQFGRGAAQIDQVVRFAAGAEEHGAESLWVGARLLAPVNPTVNYGDLDHVPAVMRASHDPLTLLGVAAAVTSHVLLGTSTINAPWYPPPLLARQTLTLDQVSGGRLVLGLGIGWSPDEYAAVGVPWEERGARLDECLDVLAAWWHDDPVAHEGRTGTVMPSHVQVKPHGIPIYLGGWGRRPMQRAAERADGFLPVLLPGTVDQLDAVVNRPWQRLRDARWPRAARPTPSALRCATTWLPTTTPHTSAGRCVAWPPRPTSRTSSSTSWTRTRSATPRWSWSAGFSTPPAVDPGATEP